MLTHTQVQKVITNVCKSWKDNHWQIHRFDYQVICEDDHWLQTFTKVGELNAVIYTGWKGNYSCIQVMYARVGKMIIDLCRVSKDVTKFKRCYQVK